MPKFEYQGLDSAGAAVSGQIEAADMSSAREQLLARGLTAVAVRLFGPEPAPGRPTVSPADAMEIATRLAELTSADLPLAPALRALAVDMPRSRLATALGRLADHLDRGASLEAAVNMPDVRLPAYLRGVLACGINTGQLPLVLEQFLAHQQLSYELRRRVWSSLGYPIMLLMALGLWCWFILAFIVPSMAKIYYDFGIELPSSTRSLIWLADRGPAIFLYVLATVLVVILLARLVGGRASLSNLFAELPFIGPLWRDWGLSEFSSLLALLLQHSMPLPAALQATAAGLRDPAVAAACRRSAITASDGLSLSDCLVREPEFPWALTPILSWGERASAVPAALRSAAEMFRSRTALREQFLAVVLPPIAFIFIAVVIGYFVIALFMPLIKLIQTLSK